jgi:NADPH:quinone reductase-like Zn-dependent oxidoreductase
MITKIAARFVVSVPLSILTFIYPGYSSPFSISSPLASYPASTRTLLQRGIESQFPTSFIGSSSSSSSSSCRSSSVDSNNFEFLSSSFDNMKRIDLIKVGGFVAGEHIVTSDVPTPTANELQNGQIIIHVEASAINPVDWKQALYGFLMPPNQFPVALGCDVAGTVTATASDTTEYMGQRVVVYLGANKTPRPTNAGAFVEQLILDTDVVAIVPESMSSLQATTLPVGALTAYQLMEAITPALSSLDSLKKWVVVWGASSSVGHFAVQLALLQGWEVIAVASAAHKDLIQNKLGAQHFVDYRVDDVSSAVKEILNGDKLVAAMDPIGDKSTVEACRDLIVSNGHDSKVTSAVGTYIVSTTNGMSIPSETHGIKFVGVDLGTTLDSFEGRQWVKSRLPTVMTLQPQSVLTVRGPYSAETVEKGFSASQKGVSGQKVVIEWTSE